MCYMHTTGRGGSCHVGDMLCNNTPFEQMLGSLAKGVPHISHVHVHNQTDSAACLAWQLSPTPTSHTMPQSKLPSRLNSGWNAHTVSLLTVHWGVEE